jgi:hypothetical protein
LVSCFGTVPRISTRGCFVHSISATLFRSAFFTTVYPGMLLSVEIE